MVRPDEVLWTEGNRDAIAIFSNADIVASISPNLSLLAGLPFRAMIVTAAGGNQNGSTAGTTAGSSSDPDFVYRFFGPRIGISEDPVTGSAQCSLAPIWADRLARPSLFPRQLSARYTQSVHARARQTVCCRSSRSLRACRAFGHTCLLHSFSSLVRVGSICAILGSESVRISDMRQ